MNLQKDKAIMMTPTMMMVMVTCRTFMTKWRFATAHLYSLGNVSKC